jgi:hypothetical protein
VYVRSGGVWTQQQKLTADDAAENDEFGRSVSVSGDTAVVGAWMDDDGGNDSGSAYVYMRSGSVWTQQQKLTADDGAASDEFGRSVSVSGDTTVVGAWRDDEVGVRSGSAYVYVRSGGVWTQQQKLTASDAAPGGLFGTSVSVSGDTLIVGATGDEAGGYDSGSAYVYVRSDGVWTQEQKLTADDAAAYDRFGESVSVFGDTTVVGAYDDDDGGKDSGSAYVYVRNGGVWTQQQKLTANDAAMEDAFGLSVSVSGDTAVVGAIGDVAGGNDSGSAYVYVRNGGVWTQGQNLIPWEAPSSDQRFGLSVSVSGGTAIVGAPGESNSGSAYVFTIDTTLPVISNIGIDRTNAQVGDTIIITFDVEEELLGDPTVTVNEIPATIQGGKASFAYEWTVPEGTASGPLTIEVQATDLAGNTGTASTSPILTVSASPPIAGLPVAAWPVGLALFAVATAALRRKRR